MVQAKCKSCGKTYKAPGEYGIGNMTRHMKSCARKDTFDVGQMLLSGSDAVRLSGLQRRTTNNAVDM